jgi:hypothetical protein
MTRRASKVRDEEWENKKAEIEEKKAELSKLAASLFDPVGKNPYYLNRRSSNSGDMTITIKNLSALRDHLDVFSEGEALWLAMWIEYLGDKETAERIRQKPEKFKEIIAERHEELREFYN